MQIILSKRFETLDNNRFYVLVDLVKEKLHIDEVKTIVPLWSPYDLLERDKITIGEQFTANDSLKHIINIVNYLINSLFQTDFATIYYDNYVIQRAALWLACRYYSTNDNISRQIAFKQELAALPENKESDEFKSFIKLENLVKQCVSSIEEQVIKAMNLMNQGV